MLSVAAAGTLTTACEPTPPRLPAGTVAVDVAAGNGHGGGETRYSTKYSGRRGGVALIPGFTEGRAAVDWYGSVLADLGFVVFTPDSITALDQPSARATQLLAALDHLTAQGSVRDRVDAGRLAVGGHESTNPRDATIEAQLVAWMKRFVNGDSTQNALVCPPPAGPDISRSASTCPF